ncbi:Protein of unknown function [Gryllus bimaculatus]|nr:Protein of unknown function [Gryllus bimaculatus]
MLILDAHPAQFCHHMTESVALLSPGLPRHSSAAATLPQASPPPPVRFAFATEPRHIRVTTASRLIFSIRTRWLDDDACGLNDVDEGNRRSVVDEDGWMRRIAITSLPWLPRDRRLAINASRRQATTRIRAIFTGK